MTSVLYDVPGPRAAWRHRVLGVVTVVVVVAIVGLVVYRLVVTGQLGADKWRVFTYAEVWRQVGQATLRTLAAFASAAVASLVVGLLLGVSRLSSRAWVRRPAAVVVEMLRAVPVLILMMLLYYGLPTVGIRVSTYWAVVIALTAYNGSIIAEVVRAGVEALPRGQREAGRALGLREGAVLRLILLPQAIRAMLPVIVAQLVVTLKDTALGFIITYNELLYYARLIGTQAQYDSPILPAGIVVAAIYIGLCLALSGVARWLATRARRGSHPPSAAALADLPPGADLAGLGPARAAEVAEQRRDDAGA